MKAFMVFSMALLFFFSCGQPTDKNILEKEIFATEKSFEKMCAEKGVAEAFYFFADDSAVIKRGNDTLIIGKENIKNYHNNDFYKTASVKWAPDFIDVSNDGSMAYTYGKYIWTVKDENENEKQSEFKEFFILSGKDKKIIVGSMFGIKGVTIENL